ncbi:MAG: DNA polymerase domain-containing protein [Candidatus Babeliales bacterium]
MGLLNADVTKNYQYGMLLDLYEIGGKRRRVQPPFKPYCYSLRSVSNGKPVTKIFLSDLKPHTVWRCEFSDCDELTRNRNAWTIEDNFPFKMRIGIDIGYRFPSEYPKILAWDIESFTSGLTPDWRKDRIRSIATWNGTEGKFFYGDDERKIIEDFIKYVRQQDPDVLCDFFGRFYDMMVLQCRCEALCIPLELGRDGSQPYLLKNEFERKGRGKIEHTFRIRGRVHFDFNKETDADYTLTLAGLKNRGLKAVSKHYGYNPVEIDYDKMDSMTFEELRDYNISDAYVTYEVGNAYLRTLWALTELLDIPLEMIVQRTPSFIPNVVLGRELSKIDVVSDGSNADRFPQFFAGGKKAVQGAEPKSFVTGVFAKPKCNVKHKDFSSMYVSILRALNLSPERITLVSINPYTGQYHFKPEKDCCILELPDEINGQVTMRIDLSKKGVMRSFLDEIVEKRKVVKAKFAETKNPKYKSDETALKLVGNILWGYNSMPFAKYGNVLIAVCCTAIPRLLINESMKLERKAGNLILEVDTDGYWYVENKPVEFKASDVLPDCFETDLITQGVDDIEGIILLEDVKGDPAAKSYILKEDDGKITKHGSSILSRSISYIVDYFVDELAVCLFNGEDPLHVLRRWNARKIESYPTKDFVQYVTLSKRPDDYEPTTMYAGLIKKLQSAKIPVQWGDKINYVVCVNGYVPTILLTERHKVNARAYQEKMASIASRILQLPYKRILSYMKGDTLLESYSNQGD